MRGTSAKPKVEKRPMRHRWKSFPAGQLMVYVRCIRAGCTARKHGANYQLPLDRSCRAKAVVKRTPARSTR